jgi:two-component system, NarL family, response regulator NreC
MMKKFVKIILVDDHEIVRDGIRSILTGQNGITVIAEAASTEEMFEKLGEHKADIILLDISMPGGSGLEALGKLKEEFPDTRIIMLSANTGEQDVKKAVKSGCSGFLPKDCSKKELLEAIEKVSDGLTYFGKNIQDIVFSGFVEGVQQGKKHNLPVSDRELEVIICLANGLSHKETAQKLFISPRTVDSHKKAIYEKLNLSNLSDLIKFAIKNELIEI